MRKSVFQHSIDEFDECGSGCDGSREELLMEFRNSGGLEQDAHPDVGAFDGFDNSTIFWGPEGIVAGAESHGCHNVESQVVAYCLLSIGKIIDTEILTPACHVARRGPAIK